MKAPREGREREAKRCDRSDALMARGCSGLSRMRRSAPATGRSHSRPRRRRRRRSTSTAGSSRARPLAEGAATFRASRSARWPNAIWSTRRRSVGGRIPSRRIRAGEDARGRPARAAHPRPQAHGRVLAHDRRHVGAARARRSWAQRRAHDGALLAPRAGASARGARRARQTLAVEEGTAIGARSVETAEEGVHVATAFFFFAGAGFQLSTLSTALSILSMSTSGHRTDDA